MRAHGQPTINECEVCGKDGISCADKWRVEQSCRLCVCKRKIGLSTKFVLHLFPIWTVQLELVTLLPHYQILNF